MATIKRIFRKKCCGPFQLALLLRLHNIFHPDDDDDDDDGAASEECHGPGPEPALELPFAPPRGLPSRPPPHPRRHQHFQPQNHQYHQPVLKNRGRHNKLKFEVTKFTGLSLLGIPNKQGVLGVQAVLHYW